MEIRESLETLVNQALQAAVESGALALDELPPAALERPRDLANGDWASTVAMRTAKLAGMAPRDVAQTIVDNLPANNLIAATEIAGPGFINFRLAPAAFQSVVARVREEGADYGRSTTPAPTRVNLEYISANPTGPMHVGHGRWAALGDSMARVMTHAGYNVHQEFYVNDHGNQMNVFGHSISVRYMQQLGHPTEMPEDCYGGAYVTEIARAIIDREGNKYESLTEEERTAAFRKIGQEEMLTNQRELLERFGTNFDCWFSESSLYVPNETSGQTAVDRALQAMREKGYIYEQDGATWFRSTDFGDDKDRVLIKADGDLTYFASDMAYHYDKVQRGFDQLIDIWGADHHGYIKRCQAMMEAWDHGGQLEVVLGQLVNLLRDGEPVRMSKRTGEMVTFEELVNEVGVDATRFLMLSRSSDQMIDFDIEVAKKQDASNPVYYVQYAHARICSLLRKAASVDAEGVAEGAGAQTPEALAAKAIPANVDLSVLTEEPELALMRKLDDFGELVALAARDRAPFRLTHYAQELAALFHQFYNSCRIMGEPAPVQNARLALADATRIVLALTMNLLGVSAPTRM